MIPGWKDSTGTDPSPLFLRLPSSVRSMGTILTPVTIWSAFLCLAQTTHMGLSGYTMDFCNRISPPSIDTEHLSIYKEHRKE